MTAYRSLLIMILVFLVVDVLLIFSAFVDDYINPRTRNTYVIFPAFVDDYINPRTRNTYVNDDLKSYDLRKTHRINNVQRILNTLITGGVSYDMCFVTLDGLSATDDLVAYDDIGKLYRHYLGEKPTHEQLRDIFSQIKTSHAPYCEYNKDLLLTEYMENGVHTTLDTQDELRSMLSL